MKNAGRDESTVGKMSEKRGEMSEDERGEMSEQPWDAAGGGTTKEEREYTFSKR